LAGTEITPEGTEAIARIVFPHFPDLKKFSFDGKHNHDAAQTIGDAGVEALVIGLGRYCPHLEELSIIGESVGR
jgi:hypothetical protein